jgi:hypothetical protein
MFVGLDRETPMQFSDEDEMSNLRPNRTSHANEVTCAVPKTVPGAQNPVPEIADTTPLSCVCYELSGFFRSLQPAKKPE